MGEGRGLPLLRVEQQLWNQKEEKGEKVSLSVGSSCGTKEVSRSRETDLIIDDEVGRAQLEFGSETRPAQVGGVEVRRCTRSTVTG